MSDSFDPLHHWLGIPPHEQPPHAYRLLGLRLWESDPRIIAAAADQRIAYVQGFQAGPHAAAASGVLGQLTGARARLLDPQQKMHYDQQLHAWLQQQSGQVAGGWSPAHGQAAVYAAGVPAGNHATGAAIAAPVDVSSASPAIRAHEPNYRLRRRRKNASHFQILAVVIGLICFGSLAFGLYALLDYQQTTMQQPTSAPAAPSGTAPQTDPLLPRPGTRPIRTGVSSQDAMERGFDPGAPRVPKNR